MVTSPPCTTNPTMDPTDCQANLAFNPFLDSAGVKTIIELGASSSFDSLTGTIANTPEPATWLLGFGGCLLYTSIAWRIPQSHHWRSAAAWGPRPQIRLAGAPAASVNGWSDNRK